MSSCGVYVRTWGTRNDNEDSGIAQFSCHYMTHTNVGHASLEMVLSDTPENWQMVERYLKNTAIPFKREKIEIKKIFYPNGKVEVSSDNAYEEKIIKIYFSLWPAENDKGFEFISLEEDLVHEREAVDMPCTPEWENYLQPEKRFRQSCLSKIITLPPFQTVHFRGANKDETAILQAYHLVTKALQDIKALQLLFQKINRHTGFYIYWEHLSESEKLLLKQFLPKLSQKSDEPFIHTIELTKQLNTYANKLTHDYVNYSSSLEDMLTRLDEKEKENLLLALSILKSETADKNVKTILSKYNLKDLTASETCEWIEHILQKRGQAPQTLASLDPLIQATDTALKMLKIEIFSLSEIEIAIKEYFSLVQWAPHRGTSPEYLAKKRTELSHLIQEHYSECDFDKDIYKILIAINAQIAKLKAQKKDQKESRILLLKKQEQANEDKFYLGNQSLNVLIEKHITTGLMPDETIHLSLKTATREGLHPEKMLQKMASLANSPQKFGLVTFNCSHGVSEILAEGAESRADIFRQRAFNGSIVTPQVVYNNTQNYLRSLSVPIALKSPEEATSWQNYFANCAVSNFEEYIKPDAPLLTKGWNAIKALTAATASLSLSEGSALLARAITSSPSQ